MWALADECEKHTSFLIWRENGCPHSSLCLEVQKTVETCCVGLGHMAKAHCPLRVGNVFVYYSVQRETHPRFKSWKCSIIRQCVQTVASLFPLG